METNQRQRFQVTIPVTGFGKTLSEIWEKNIEDTKLNADLPTVYPFPNDLLNDHNKTVGLLYHNNAPIDQSEIDDVPSDHNDMLISANENAPETSEELVNDLKGLTLTGDGWIPFLNDNNENVETVSNHNEFSLDQNKNNRDLAKNEKFAEMRNDNTKSPADFKTQKMHKNVFPVHIAVGRKKVCHCLTQ